MKQAEPLCAFTVPTFKRAYRITSLCFSPEGEEILVSYSSDDLYLFSLRVMKNILQIVLFSEYLRSPLQYYIIIMLTYGNFFHF